MELPFCLNVIDLLKCYPKEYRLCLTVGYQGSIWRIGCAEKT